MAEVRQIDLVGGEGPHPTPWREVDSNESEGAEDEPSGTWWDIVDAEEEYVLTLLPQDVAHRIVRAVNSHESR